jgi:hypothetical protein
MTFKRAVDRDRDRRTKADKSLKAKPPAASTIPETVLSTKQLSHQ